MWKERSELISKSFPSGFAVVIMGVSGSGKSTIAALLGKEIGCPFVDADDFHSKESKEKMQNGIPLTEYDRIPWLESLRDILIDYILKGERVVLACSALSRNYRDILRTADYNYSLERQEKTEQQYTPSSKLVIFMCLQGSVEQFASRVQARFKQGKHFMPPSLLKSQMDSLDIDDEEGVIFLDASLPPTSIVSEIKDIYLPQALGSTC